MTTATPSVSGGAVLLLVGVSVARRSFDRHLDRCDFRNANGHWLHHQLHEPQPTVAVAPTVVSIVVNDVAPSSITYTPSSLSLTKDV